MNPIVQVTQFTVQVTQLEAEILRRIGPSPSFCDVDLAFYLKSKYGFGVSESQNVLSGMVYCGLIRSSKKGKPWENVRSTHISWKEEPLSESLKDAYRLLWESPNRPLRQSGVPTRCVQNPVSQVSLGQIEALLKKGMLRYHFRDHSAYPLQDWVVLQKTLEAVIPSQVGSARTFTPNIPSAKKLALPTQAVTPLQEVLLDTILESRSDSPMKILLESFGIRREASQKLLEEFRSMGLLSPRVDSSSASASWHMGVRQLANYQSSGEPDLLESVRLMGNDKEIFQPMRLLSLLGFTLEDLKNHPEVHPQGSAQGGYSNVTIQTPTPVEDPAPKVQELMPLTRKVWQKLLDSRNPKGFVSAYSLLGRDMTKNAIRKHMLRLQKSGLAFRPDNETWNHCQVFETPQESIPSTPEWTTPKREAPSTEAPEAVAPQAPEAVAPQAPELEVQAPEVEVQAPEVMPEDSSPLQPETALQNLFYRILLSPSADQILSQATPATFQGMQEILREPLMRMAQAEVVDFSRLHKGALALKELA